MPFRRAAALFINVHITPNAGLLMVVSPTPTDPALAGWFDDGVIIFTSGALDGLGFEIKSWDGTTLTMNLPLPAVPAASDTFIIESGCDHLITGCQLHDNIVNMQAEPLMPGADSLYLIPDATYNAGQQS